MKKVFSALVVALIASVSTSNIALASDNNVENKVVKVVPIGDTKFRLALNNMSERSSLTIRDYAGVVIYSESVRQSEGYKKIFDLSTLRDGRYSFVVVNGNERIEKPFEISTSVVRSAAVIEK